MDFNPDDVHSRIEALNTQKLQLIRKKEKLENEKDQINTNLGKLNHELLQGEKDLNVHFQNMVSVSRRYTLPGNTIDKSAITPDSSKKLLRALKDVRDNKMQLVEDAEKTCNVAKEELSRARQALEVEERSNNNQIDDRKKRKDDLGLQLKVAREKQSSSNRSRLELEKQRNLEDVLKTKKRLDDFQSGGEEKNAEEKLCALKAKRDQLTAEIKALRTNCEICERNASVLRSIELKKDAAESELSALNNIKADIEVDLRQLLDEDASSDLERLCDRVGSQLQLKQELYKSAQEKLMNLRQIIKQMKESFKT